MIDKKTILYVRTDQYHQELIAGGSVSHTLGVITGFLQSGYDVVVCSSAMQSLLKNLPLKKFVFLSNPASLSFLRWKINCILSNVFFTRRCLQVLQENPCEVIYQRYCFLNMVGVLLRFFKKIPLILEYNGSEAWIEKNWNKKRTIKLLWLAQAIEKLNLNYADVIVVVSEPLKEELLQRGIPAHKILVNPNGVDTDIYDPSALQDTRETMRRELGINEAFVFGFVGTFSYWHGVEILAYMIPELVRLKKHVHFLLIGDGILRDQLQKELEQHGIDTRYVTFTGLVMHQHAKNYLAACDAFLCPTQPNPDGTRFFGSPTKMFEYMSMGKPIIASNIEQVAELMVPSLDLDASTSQNQASFLGYVVKPDDKNGFVKAALHLLECDVKMRKMFGDNSRTKALMNYTWKSHVGKIINRYSAMENSI